MNRILVGCALLVVCAPFACNDDPQSHVYVAAPYSVGGACFGPSTSLGYVDTPSGDLDCAPTCLVRSSSGGAETIYVSTMCGPYPTQLDSSQIDPDCPAAIAAWPEEQAALGEGTNSCASPADGGSSSAEGGSEAGGPIDGGSDDASVDQSALDAGDAGAPLDASAG